MNTDCTVSYSAEKSLSNESKMGPVNSRPKIPIERRRRNKLQEMLPTPGGATTPLRRESDRVKARLQRWIDLADKALGRSRNAHKRPTELSKPGSPDLENPEL